MGIQVCSLGLNSPAAWHNHHPTATIVGRSVQVCIPVQIPGQAVTSVSLLSLHKSDMRLLETAAKLGPLIAEAGQAVAEALAEEAQEEEEEHPPSNGQLSKCHCSSNRRARLQPLSQDCTSLSTCVCYCCERKQGRLGGTMTGQERQ